MKRESPSSARLSSDEVDHLRTEEDPATFIIQVRTDQVGDSVEFTVGNGERVVLPTSRFTSQDEQPAPDFSDPTLAGQGRIVRFGDYVVDTDVVFRSVQIRSEIARRAGGLLTAEEAAEHLGTSPSHIERLRRRDAQLGVERDGEYVYPRCQFTETGVVEGLPEALRSFKNVPDGWTRLSVLVSGEDELGGQRVIEALRTGHRKEAIASIRRFGRM